MQKLLIVERWMALDAERGKEMFNQLLNDLRRAFVSGRIYIRIWKEIIKPQAMGIVANLVIVEVDGRWQNEICFIQHNEERLMAEVIKVVGVNAYVQVFESTRSAHCSGGV